MSRKTRLAAMVTAMVGAGLAALIQWWPMAPGCAGCAGPACVCSTDAVAGAVTVGGVLLGAFLGAGLAVLLQWLRMREHARRRDYGQE